MHRREILQDGAHVEIEVATHELLSASGENSEEGEVYIPDHIRESCWTRICVCNVYMGMKPSINGIMMRVLLIVTTADISRIDDEQFMYEDETLVRWA